jgi:hypothetical protein
MSYTGNKSLASGEYFSLINFSPYALRRPDNYREQKKRKAICV